MALQDLSPSPMLGSVLVTGGCGFLGTHLVQTLLNDRSCTCITVLDRSPPFNPLPNVTYILGSITSPTAISSAFKQSTPITTIFHAASPNFTFPSGDKNDFHHSNVTGTELLLSAAKGAGVKAFIFTSTADAYASHRHHNLVESSPLWTTATSLKGNEYALSKSLADSLVLRAATPTFKTVSLRVAHLYGDGDTHAIPAALDSCTGSKPLFQLGNGENVMEILSLENCSSAHILAAKALLNPSLAHGNVNGEAFNVSDGHPVRFWEFFEVIWGEARGRDVKDEMWVIPKRLVLFLVVVMEWLYFILTFGLLSPKGVWKLERSIMVYCLESHCYDISKIREVLGWRAKGDWEIVLRSSVRWEMERRGTGEKEGKSL